MLKNTTLSVLMLTVLLAAQTASASGFHHAVTTANPTTPPSPPSPPEQPDRPVCEILDIMQCSPY
jgi:hypothetical protein